MTSMPDRFSYGSQWLTDAINIVFQYFWWQEQSCRRRYFCGTKHRNPWLKEGKADVNRAWNIKLQVSFCKNVLAAFIRSSRWYCPLKTHQLALQNKHWISPAVSLESYCLPLQGRNTVDFHPKRPLFVKNKLYTWTVQCEASSSTPAAEEAASCNLNLALQPWTSAFIIPNYRERTPV